MTATLTTGRNVAFMILSVEHNGKVMMHAFDTDTNMDEINAKVNALQKSMLGGQIAKGAPVNEILYKQSASRDTPGMPPLAPELELEPAFDVKAGDA